MALGFQAAASYYVNQGAVQLKSNKKILLILYTAASSVLIVTLMYFGYFKAKVDGFEPKSISCRSWMFFEGPNCGLNGKNCRPFVNQDTLIRCPTRCVWDLDPRLRVIGAGPYRGNSRICKAAVHAGVISAQGGCARLRLTGAQIGFEGNERNGVGSSSYDSWFPKTFDFVKSENEYCTDLSWYNTCAMIMFVVGLAYFENVNSVFLFLTLNFVGYWYVEFIGQPTSTHYPTILVNGLTKVWIVMMLSYALYQLAPKYTLKVWKEKSMRYRFAFWGLAYIVPYWMALSINVFSYIPWLNMDLGGFQQNDQINAWTYIVYGIAAISASLVVFWHIKHIFLDKKISRYVTAYVAGTIFVAIASALFPEYRVHIHHVMVGAILLPISRFHSIPSAILQGYSMGIFIHGYTVWGWDPFLEPKPANLRVPLLQSPFVNASTILNSSAIVAWNSSEYADGYNLMLNGVQVYRGVEPLFNLTNLISNLTYYVSVSAISYGTNGFPSDETSFITA